MTQDTRSTQATDAGRTPAGAAAAGPWPDQGASLHLLRPSGEPLQAANADRLRRAHHDLRTPLNAVLGFAQLLLADRQRPLDPTQRFWVEHIEQGGYELLAAIEEHVQDGVVR